MVRRSSARLSAKAASTTKTPSQSLTKQKTAAKPAKSRSSTATVAAAAAAAFDSSSDNDNGSDAPSTKRRRRNNGTASTIKKNNVAVIENAASTKTSKAVSPTSFEFSRAGTTDTAMTSGSDSATLRRRKRQLKNQNDDEDEGDDLDEEGDSGDFTERPEFEDSEELEPLFSDFAEGSEFEDYEEGPEFRDSGDDEDGDYEEDKSKNLSKVGRKWKGRSVPVDILEEKHTAQHKAAKPGLLHGRMCQDRYIPYWMPSEDLEETQKSRFEKLQKEYGGLHKEEYDSDVLDEEDPDFPRTAFVPDDPHNTRRSTNDRALLYYYHGELRNVWLELGLRRNITVKEDPQPPGLALKLLPFQKEGLHWMRVQEKSAYKGGILADEMGMGKTIQTLALIMTDPNAGPNLVVAPTVALMQWKSEIEKYTGDALKVYLFHGASRSTDHKELSKYNVILTSYNLVESVYRKQQTGYRRKNGIVKEDSGLHKVMYHRVILDEAHNIKDRTSNTAKAVFALKTKYKLCLSGTPLQNRIGELFSLLRFLEIDPFAYYYCRKCPCKQLQWKFSNNRSCDSCGCSPMSHISFFNYECLKPIQRDGNTGAGKIAYNNIRHLLKHIMLRRTKNEREDDLGLPNKVVRIRKDKFSEEELDLYDSIFSDGKRKFETYVSQGVVLNNYANIFTLITRMRQMADHPDLVLRKHIEDGQVTLVCGICDEEAEEAIKSKCHHTYCRDCVQRYVSGFCGNSAPECPKCHIPLVIDLAAPAIEPDSYQPKHTSIVNRIDMTNWRSSTKIEALCHELYRLRRPYQTTKSIVFSQFTSMLQLIEWRLNHAGFKTVMLQGSMSPAQRDATIKYFMTHVEVEVFLVSLKAGGVALNLIEANHVFLMEPWWNPSVEWQAADRIHRIGQTRVCTVTRMVVDDSIESRIIELQEKKTRMIEATVNADQKAMERLTADDMRFLFQN